MKLLFFCLLLQIVSSFKIPNIFHSYHIHNLHINEKIVNDIATALPNIDTIGHQVVLLNKNLVDVLLHDHNIPIEVKKDIILCFIKISQEGDNIGGVILNNYYHLVNYFL